MLKNSQSGFSLIELLLVITIIGIISAVGIPSFQKGIKAADNGAAFAQLRVISSMQLSFYSQKGRWARLAELNALTPGALGVTGPTSITKGRFIYEMTPLSPTDADLKDSYTVTASGTNGVAEAPYVFRLDHSGEIVQITP